MDRLRTLHHGRCQPRSTPHDGRGFALSGNMLKLLRRVRKVFSHLISKLDDREAVADTESETHLRGFRWVRCEKRKGIVATAPFCALFPVPDRQS